MGYSRRLMWKGGLLTLGMSSVLSLGLADKYEYEYQSIFVFIFWSKFNHIHVPRLAVLEYEYIHERKRLKSIIYQL